MTRPGVGDEVAAVADDDRVAVEHLAELLVEPHRVQRRAVVGQLGLLGRALLGLGRAQAR